MSPVILIIGAGQRIGRSVAAKFASQGYKVALVARSHTPGISVEGYLQIKADLSVPSAVPKVFQEVKSTLGLPNVVVYNAYSRTVGSPADPLSTPIDIIERDRTATVDSAYIAAQEALRCFREVPAEMAKTFIYTGNALNQLNLTIPAVIGFAMGKSSASAMIQACAKAYGSQGYRFYYTDERQADGRIAGEDVSGSAAAEFYWELAKEGEQGPWLATFVKGKGYVSF